MMLHVLGVCAFICLTLCSQANAKAAVGGMVSVADIPNPMVQPELCGRPGVAHSAICDLSEALSKEDKDVIEGRINGFNPPNNAEGNTKHAQFAVAVVRRMKTDSAFENVETAAARFAKSIHDRWGVGERATNNGVLLFLSIDDRQVFISPGAGVLKQLSKPVLDSVIHHMKPHLRAGRYGRAVEGAVVELDMLVKGEKPTSTVGSGEDEGGGEWLVYGIIILLFGCIFWMAQRERLRLQRLRTGQRVLDSLVRDVSAVARASTETAEAETEAGAGAGAGAGEGGAFFAAQSCPICLEDFEGEGAAAGAPVGESNEQEQEQEPQAAEPGASNVVESCLSAAGSRKKPMALRCGHVFCMPCLQEYIKSVQGAAGGVYRCPICRQSLDGGSGAATAAEDGSAAEAGAEGRHSGAAAPGVRTDTDAPPVDRDESHRRNGSFGGNDHGYDGGGSSSFDNPSCGGSSSSSSGSRYTNDPWRPSMFDRRPELLFRLGRVHHLYPDVLPLQSRASMERALEGGRFTEFAAEANARQRAVQTILDDAAKRAEASRSGEGGSSSGGFGGGCSSGGGSGGGW